MQVQLLGRGNASHADRHFCVLGAWSGGVGDVLELGDMNP